MSAHSELSPEISPEISPALAFTGHRLGATELKNRIAMAPMTRSRAYGAGATPTELMATYYAQRAGAGLIVTEGTQPSVVGQGYPDTPGLHSDEQVAAWRSVTDAVHAAGGVIFAQLMHVGRIGHGDLLPGDEVPVGPSAIAAEGQLYTHSGMQPFPVPRELTEPEIAETIAAYAEAARNAIAAGFDGVELHGGNGYLIHQFLAPNANVRADGWGGSPQARARFGAEAASAVVEAIGADRVGFRISPGNTNNGIAEPDESDRDATYVALVTELAALRPAYLHIMETGADQRELTLRLRAAWPTSLILNPFSGLAPTGLDALELIEDGTTDLIAFGRLFLANPDLPERLAVGGPFNAPDFTKAYGGDERGYTDYPTLATAE